jgi:peptidoglycan/LPS O-acetylase OafA/YrhL
MSRPPAVHHAQLDALRAFAVGSVLLAHFSPTLHGLAPDLGFAGVRLFFVLSGFLITGILLRARDAIRSGESTLRAEIRRFLVRRALRILPAFYLLLLANALLDIGSTRTDFWWHALYLSNIPMGLDGRWRDLLTHLWSLAVEQQFYLVWPWLVLGLARVSMPTLLIGACAIGPLFRLGCVLLAPENTVAPVVLPPACLDHLAAGGLVAWLGHKGATAGPARALVRKIGLACLPLALACTLAAPPPWQGLLTVVGPALQAFAFAALVEGAAIGFAGPVGALLTWRPLLWLGSISYGVYLFHNDAHWIGPRILRQLTRYETAYLPSEWLHVAYLVLLSILAAAASWWFVERPILRLKSRFAP